MAPDNVSKEQKLETWDRSLKTAQRVGSGGAAKTVRPSGEELAGAFGVTSQAAASSPARCPFGFDRLAAAADDVLEVGLFSLVV